jgi:hypothetical protein
VIIKRKKRYGRRQHLSVSIFIYLWSRDSSVGIATRYGLDGPGIEWRCGRNFPLKSRTALRPTQWVPGFFPWVQRPGAGVALTTHPIKRRSQRKNRAIPLFPLWAFVACMPNMRLDSLRKFTTNFSQSSLQSRPNLSRASPQCKLKCGSYANLFSVLCFINALPSPRCSQHGLDCDSFWKRKSRIYIWLTSLMNISGPSAVNIYKLITFCYK